MAHHMINDILQQVDGVIEHIVFQGYQQLVSMCQPDMILMMTLYITLMGLAMMQGWIEFSINDFVKRILKMMILFTLATQWEIFSRFVYNLFTQVPNELSVHLIQGIGHIDSDKTVTSSLQLAFDKAMYLGVLTWVRASFSAVSFYLYAIAIWLGSLLIAGLVLLDLILAKFATAILLTLAPLFLMLGLWRNTMAITENWLRYLIGFALIPIFVTAVLLLILNIIDASLITMETALNTKHYTLLSVTPYLLCVIVSIGLLRKIGSMATSLASGISLAYLAQPMQWKRWLIKTGGDALSRQKLIKHFFDNSKAN